VAELVLGTANIGQRYGRKNAYRFMSKTEAKMILRTAKERGIGFLDSSANYGDAHSIIAQWLRMTAEKPFKIITKVSDEKQLDLSIESFRENLYALLAHGLQAFKNLYKDLKHLDVKIGVSLYHPSELSKIEFGSRIDIIEVPFNLLDQTWNPVLPTLKKRGIEIIARSIFLHGTLFDIQYHGIPLSYVSYNLARLNPLLDKIIIGVDTPEQLDEICEIPLWEVDYESLGNPRSTSWLKQARGENPHEPCGKDCA
jgi:diketogulonate reductase-like aldo/keto reductase